MIKILNPFSSPSFPIGLVLDWPDWLKCSRCRRVIDVHVNRDVLPSPEAVKCPYCRTGKAKWNRMWVEGVCGCIHVVDEKPVEGSR